MYQKIVYNILLFWNFYQSLNFKCSSRKIRTFIIFIIVSNSITVSASVIFIMKRSDDSTMDSDVDAVLSKYQQKCSNESTMDAVTNVVLGVNMEVFRN